MIINIIWCFAELFSKNKFILECSPYYPIVIVNIYFLCYSIKTKETLFNSFFLQLLAMIYAGFMFKKLGFQYDYY